MEERLSHLETFFNHTDETSIGSVQDMPPREPPEAVVEPVSVPNVGYEPHTFQQSPFISRSEQEDIRPDGSWGSNIYRRNSPMPSVAVDDGPAVDNQQYIPRESSAQVSDDPPVPSTPTLSSFSSTLEDDGISMRPPEEEMTFEYHGLGSFISICSKPGIDWVCRRTGSTDFEKTARKLASDVCHRLKLEDLTTIAKEPEPSEADAWAYTRAYFEESVEGSIGLVYRPQFENLLRAHFQQEHTPTVDQDPAWYALRYIIYAAGWRVQSWKKSYADYHYARGPGWGYFQNALSVHSKLLYCRTSLMAIQALAAMSMYVECIGCPALDWMLCLNAMKLAESKGLHTRPAAAWDLPDTALQLRSHVWWSLFVYERHIVYRSARPLAIDDDDITCQLPEKPIDGNATNLDYFVHVVKHAQISGRIARAITRLRKSKQSFHEVKRILTTLQSTLDQWYESLPATVRINTTTNEFPRDLHPMKTLYLLFSYYGSTIAINSVMVNFWNTLPIHFEATHYDEARDFISQCTEVVAEAARNIVRNLRHVAITPSTPKCLVYVFPLTALIALFAHVLKFPDRPAVGADIQFMDMVAGHMNYVEFASADLHFPFARDVVNLARFTVMKAGQQTTRRTTTGSWSKTLRGGGDGGGTEDVKSAGVGGVAGAAGISDGLMMHMTSPEDPMSIFNRMDMELESWGDSLLWLPDTSLPPLPEDVLGIHV
ncbi:hypothetical protein AYO21_02861 [Fonsecaea monophora]|uniref:Xylanolytic transcriptional activator regulatory domain-containing protein n=1 Tax=Fonsecaea monophora TaxID=254056 RepID=A0A177FH20_9EURO|nr:hypothetical protein AYO21_02861 [Fonsecaea monophora]OAG42910.1 hypothetical protein AYO21_02861 [Fonsecaea monophora]